VAHAYLFSGLRGVGKTTTARLVARAINCSSLKDGEPCGDCAPCRAISEGHFIDVIEIDAASNRGIDEIRQLRDSVRYAPIEGRSKVYIIDEVHMLTQEAFNALLKTLEEPPEHAYFCLATTAPQKVPATILSRCQRFDFRRVPAPEIRDHLEKICTKEEIEYEPEAFDLIARKADGSIRDSLSLLDQIIAYAGGKVTRKETIEVIGDVRLDLFFRAVDLANSGASDEAFKLDQELASSGIDPQDYIAGLQAHLVQILQTKAVGPNNIDLPEEAREQFSRTAEQLGEGDLIRLLQYCSTAEVDIRRNFDPRGRVQLLLLKFATFDRSVDLADLLKQIEGKTGSTPSRISSPDRSGTEKPRLTAGKQTSLKPLPPGTTGRPSTPTSSSPAEVKGSVEAPSPAEHSDHLMVAQTAWDELCDRISLEQNSSGRMIKHGGFPVAYENGKLKLHFASRSHYDAAHTCRQALHRELSALIGEVKLELEVGEVPERPVTGTTSETDPAVQLLNRRLDARPAKSS